MSVVDRAIIQSLPDQPRILIVDLETLPMTVLCWQPKVKWVPPSMVLDKGGMCCFAAKWYGERNTMFVSEWGDGSDAMMQRAFDLLDEAHIVVGYNSQGFDCKILMAEIAMNGGRPPSPWKDVDLIKTARQRFRFKYNSLNEVCRDLGLDMKLDTDIELWKGVMAGDAKAQRQMMRYNRNDVVVTEQLYDRLRPWIKNHPNINLYTADGLSGCHVCASQRLEPAGFKYAATRTYRMFRCLVCDALSQTTHTEGRVANRKGAA